MTEPIPNPELNKESKAFSQIALEIKKPDGIHQWEIIFENDNEWLIRAYTAAINDLDKKHRLGLFHQTGIQNESSYHAWEALKSNVGEKELTEIIPQIHAKAQQEYQKYLEWKWIK